MKEAKHKRIHILYDSIYIILEKAKLGCSEIKQISLVVWAGKGRGVDWVGALFGELGMFYILNVMAATWHVHLPKCVGLHVKIYTF